MNHKAMTYRQKRRFKTSHARDMHFRTLTKRTDRKARRNRSLIALDYQRIEASGIGQHQ
jgi:hypothetical protein